jgi:acetolactate synthase-1/3 small subunit
MLHTFVALVQDKPGVLTRVASLFRRLNINIVSLTVGESERPDTSRMTIVCEAPEHAAHRIRASLYKLETTVDVDEVNRSEAVVRELCLIKVAAGPNQPHGVHSRSQIFELATVFRARVVDLAPESIMLEMTGSASKIEGLLQVLRESNYQVLEVSRTGRMAMRRGHHTSRVLKALGTPTELGAPGPGSPSSAVARWGGDPDSRTRAATDLDPDALPQDEILPSEFDNDEA